MAKKGFVYPPPSATVQTQKTVDLSQWGFDDVAGAKLHGYGNIDPGAAPGLVVPSGADPVTEYYNTLARTEQKAFDLALSGDDASRVTMTSYSGQKMQFPMTGCAAAARNLVYPDLEKFVRLGTLAEGLASEVDSRVAADPAYLDALAAWRACMSDKGFHYFKPADPRTEVANDYATMSHASAHAHEISIATADAECGQQVNLVKIADARWNSYEATFEKDHQGELLAWAQMQKQALATAKTLLAKG